MITELQKQEVINAINETFARLSQDERARFAMSAKLGHISSEFLNRSLTPIVHVAKQKKTSKKA